MTFMSFLPSGPKTVESISADLQSTLLDLFSVIERADAEARAFEEAASRAMVLRGARVEESGRANALAAKIKELLI